MAQRVFVTVVGFTDEERHALNVMFRVSEENSTAFSLWEPQAPELPKVALIDGEAAQAHAALDEARSRDITILWVGPGTPEGTMRFIRPIRWGEVIQALDELFPEESDEITFDLGMDELDTQPPDTLPPDDPPRRALIASGSLEDRLYLRARLSLAGLAVADDAETAPQALELVRDRDYALAIVDLSLGGMRGWDFLQELAKGRHRIPKIIVTASRPTFGERLRARSAGVSAFLAKPADPARLQKLLAQS
jgi:CheY-like chemotaxis protein